jgi:hypothetical protein
LNDLISSSQVPVQPLLFADSDIDRSSIAEILGKNFSAEDNVKPEEISKLLEKKFRKKSSLT